MLQESCAQPEITILHLGGALVPAELKDILLFIFLEEEPGSSCPVATLLFLDCFSFVSAFSPFPDLQLFESALWNSGQAE